MDLKLMIVDDDPSILISVRELFEPEGFEVLAAGSGRECIAELEKDFRGVILMDVMMPHMDGWDTIKAIVDQGLYEGNIISMFTAKDIPDMKKMDALQDYVADYITKPFDPEELVVTVKNYIKRLQ